MRPFLPLAALVLATLLPAGAFLAAADTLDTPAVLDTDDVESVLFGRFLVGHDEGSREDALAAVLLAGGKVVREHAKLGLLVVETADAAGFLKLVDDAAGVAFVEADGRTRIMGVQWNGAEWNGAEWNGAEWNGAEWNGAEWNGEAWDARDDDPGRGLQWGLVDVDAPDAWDVTTGGGRADLCVLDSGVDYAHKDIAPNLWTAKDGSHGWNAITGTTDARDDAGHGTHVAGIAAAGVRNAYGVAGVGNASIMPVKVLSADGTGLESDLAFGLAWCAEHDAEVALMALGVSDPGPALERAIRYAAARDVLLVASAGNAGCDCVGYPASDPRVLAVTATTPERALAPFSSRGGEADLAAPGVDIVSTFPQDRFAYGSGTSQAAAFAAGAAALVRDANPSLSAASAEDVLRTTALDLGKSGKDSSYGHGLLNVEASVRKAVA